MKQTYKKNHYLTIKKPQEKYILTFIVFLLRYLSNIYIKT